MKRIKKPLTLRGETIRALTAHERTLVAGGITSYELCQSKPIQECVSWTCGVAP